LRDAILGKFFDVHGAVCLYVCKGEDQYLGGSESVSGGNAGAYVGLKSEDTFDEGSRF
jgi:hypothetical protein